MNLKLFGALIGAVMLAVAAPASAATVTGTSIVNSEGTINAGAPAHNFAPTDLTNGVQGINGDDFTSGQHYFDYIFKFSLNGPANVTLSATATAGTNLKDFHAALFSSSPAGTDLVGPGLTIDLTDTTGLLTAASTSGNGSTNTLTALNLASGDYFIRLFGAIAGNSAKNSVLTDLSGAITVAATPIPPALLLFGTALGLMGFVGWRRQAPAGSAAA